MILRKTPILVGIDAGITVGIAILDLRGNLLELRSERNWGKDEVVSLVAKHGRPVIISCDVASAPEIVHRLASAFSAKLFLPQTNMTVKDKRDATKIYDYVDDHERDSLASALFAYRSHRDLIGRLQRRAGHMEKFDQIASLILTGKVNRISDAIGKVYPKEVKYYNLLKQPRRKPEIVKTRIPGYFFSPAKKAKQQNVAKDIKKQEQKPFDKEAFVEWLKKYKEKKQR